MSMRSGLAFPLVALSVLASTAAANEQPNGVQMNGVQMNGVQMNGVQMNGVQMNGVAISGVRLDGTWLSGTAPCPDNKAGCAVGAQQLVGATFLADINNNGHIWLRLDDVQVAPNPNAVWVRTRKGWVDSNARNNPNADVWLYQFSWLERTISFHSAATWTWHPLCDSRDQNQLYNRAIPVAGHWNDCQDRADCGGKSSPDGFTLACTDVGAIAKCVQRFGYKPWRWVAESAGGVSHMQSLAPFHEACVRMVRADYCGNGTSHTSPVGITYVDDWDNLGVQTQTPGLVGAGAAGFEFEASWTPAGAYCVGAARLSHDGSVPPALAKCPQLVPPTVSTVDSCDNAAAHGHVAPTGPFPPGYNDWARPAYIANTSSQDLIQ